MPLSISTPVEIADRLLVDLWITAVEGGINYWVESCTIFNAHGKRTSLKRLDDEPQEVLTATFVVVEEEDGTRHEIKREQMEKGLQLMASIYPHHFSNLITENYDVETADIFVQFAAFEEIRYG